MQPSTSLKDLDFSYAAFYILEGSGVLLSAFAASLKDLEFSYAAFAVSLKDLEFSYAAFATSLKRIWISPMQPLLHP